MKKILLLLGCFFLLALPAAAFMLIAGSRGGLGPEAYLPSGGNCVSDPAATEDDDYVGMNSWLLVGTGANVFESQGGVVSVGSYAAHGNSEDTPSNGARFYTDLDNYLSQSTDYRMTFDVRHIGSNGDWDCGLGAATHTIDDVIVTIDNTDTTFAEQSKDFTHTTAATRYLICKEGSGTNDGGVYFDNLSIRAIY